MVIFCCYKLCLFGRLDTFCNNFLEPRISANPADIPTVKKFRELP